MTPPVIELKTLQLVAQCLNQLHHHTSHLQCDTLHSFKVCNIQSDKLICKQRSKTFVAISNKYSLTV